MENQELLATPHRIGEYSFTDEEVDKLKAAAETQEEILMLDLELALALRREDAAAIEIGNIDLEAMELTYRELKKHVWVKGVDKGSRIRTVPFGPKLKQSIVVYLNATGKTKFKKGERLFGCTGKTLYNRLRDLAIRAGIKPHGYTTVKKGKFKGERVPTWKFHAWRTTAIKRHLRANWTIAQVCALTFDSPSVIEKYYMVPSKDEMRELTMKNEVL